MARLCAGCGRSVASQRAGALYCGDTCKKRGQRAQKAAERQNIAPERGITPESGPESTLVASVHAELVEADRLNTSAGQVALELAVRLANRRELGSSVASLAKQFDAAMDKALAGVAVAADPLEEIRARRDRKRSAGRL